MSRRNGAGAKAPASPLTIFWVSDAPWHPTGYGVTTNHITQRMVKDGHRVYIYAPGALHGGKVDLPDGRTVLSSNFGDDRWGNGTLLYHLEWTRPDVVITWLDPQGLIQYGWSEHPSFMWTPVDTWPIPQEEAAILGRAERIMVCSEWGRRVLDKQGIDSIYIPCGIDLKTYNINPVGRKRWREQLRPAISDDVFLIGSVGLNTGSPDRKAYGFEFDAIRIFAERHKDIRVYIHTNAEGDAGAINLYTLRKELGLEDVICFCRPLGPLGEGELYMRDMYNAFDVLLHCGIAEGFGLPLIEAQACGTPVVGNAATAMTELMSLLCYPCEPECDMIVATSSRVALPSVENIVDGLERAYADWKRCKVERAKVREPVLRFEQNAIYDQRWRPLLEDIPARIKLGGERKLALATGINKKEGFVHHDKEKFWPHIDVAHDLTVFPWPWEDSSWDFIEFSDCLEHMRVELVQVMNELWRITAPGGYVFIHTAEAGTWQLYTDPTHVQGFALNSFDYFDPSTRIGGVYSYSERKWTIRKRTTDESGLAFILQPNKESHAVPLPGLQKGVRDHEQAAPPPDQREPSGVV